MKLKTHFRGIWVATASTLLAFAATLSTVQASETVAPLTGRQAVTTNVGGTPVTYHVPQTIKPLLSADGKQLGTGAVRPVVVIADPNPSPSMIRIPPPNFSKANGINKLTAPTAQFSIDYVPAGGTDLWGEPCYTFPESAKTAYQAAANIWAETIQSAVPIRIKACWANFAGSTLGYAGGGYLFQNFPNAPKANTWYAEPLANALSSTDRSAASYDIHITFNGNFPWYHGTDGNTPTGQYDLVSVVLHEIGHGLNLAGFMDYASGEGAYGGGSGLPSIYDTFVKDGNGVPLLNTAVYTNPSIALGAALTSNNLWFDGTAARAANGNQAVKLYAPSAWSPGSSYSHLDYATFANTDNKLMVYALSAGSSIHNPGNVTRGILQDLGWTVNSLANDSTPDTFTFTDQTNVALSTAIVSASITVSGINAAASISVFNGEYSINGGAFTSTAGTVNNADSITVRHTSGGSHSENIDTTLTIGGVTDTFTSTTLPAPIVTHTLNVNKTGTGSGTVTSIPAGINCGTDCYKIYPNNTSITLTATADVGSRFIGWAGDCSSSTGTTCTLSMTDTRYATAHFMPDTHTLNVTKTGTDAGTVTSTPAGINCGTDCTETYPTSGKIIKLTAVVGTNSLFTGWSGACSGTSTTCNVTVTNLQNVTANFNYITYNLTTVKVGNGTVSSSPAGIDCGTDCTEAVNKGSPVTLTATPDAGYKFSGWTGGCTGTATTCTVTMSAAKTVTATFKATFPLTVSKTGTGTGRVAATGINCDTSATPDCTETYIKDAAVTLTATATAGSRFTGWSGACSGTTCSVTMNEAKNVTANFDFITFNLAITKVGNGSVTSNPAGIDCGTDCAEAFRSMTPATAVTLTATPDTGYKFTGWTGGCSGTLTTCNVSMSAAKTVTATFKAIFPLTVSKTGTGTGRVTATNINCDTSAAPDCTETYLKDTRITLTATATAGSRFTGWSGACTGTTCSVTMNEAKNVTANFDFITFNLTVAKVGNGSVTSNPAGIDCGADCTEAFRSMTPATAITLTATPDAGYKFMSWTGGCSGTATTCTVSMSAAKSVIATFRPIFTLTVNKVGTGTGTVTSTPIGINCGADCTEDYVSGTAVTLTARAATGSRFTGWSGSCSGTSTCRVALSAAAAAVANFVTP
ncbi:InlB B-repeat-containing protein [Thiothrix winogradskyi]|uniref:Bacterial repeat domain-containing protein n=1 Tax=Thiothrix winogradskyi TaxID=96472 RepID=A0ABY3T1S1_9GAMM|nr:hypothetical protein [Thiothrix winogradskyi]UJS25777.1 hypothetical protein L2Y54_06965 [Thiothrix winogradskyi]